MNTHGNNIDSLLLLRMNKMRISPHCQNGIRFQSYRRLFTQRTLSNRCVLFRNYPLSQQINRGPSSGLAGCTSKLGKSVQSFRRHSTRLNCALLVADAECLSAGMLVGMPCSRRPLRSSTMCGSAMTYWPPPSSGSRNARNAMKAKYPGHWRHEGALRSGEIQHWRAWAIMGRQMWVVCLGKMAWDI